MYKKIIALILLAAALLCGCSTSGRGNASELAAVYRVNTKLGGGLVREYISVDLNEPLIDELVDALNGKSVNSEYAGAFSEDVAIIDAELSEGVLTVEMSWKYLVATELEQLVAQSAIVLTMSALDEVCYVDIVCSGVTVAEGLTVEMIAESDGVCQEYYRSLKLYLPDEEGAFLRPKTINKPDNAAETLQETMLKEIFINLGQGMESTEILSVSTLDGHCKIDLSQEFYGAVGGEISGKMVIYSIVNSLCRIPGIEKVTLTVEGMDVESYGEFKTIWPLKPDSAYINYGGTT